MCVKAAFLGGVESKLHGFLLSSNRKCTRMHQLRCGNFYLKRLFGSVSPLCLRINGHIANSIWPAHTAFCPLVGQRPPGLCSKSFSSNPAKVIFSPTSQLRSSGPAVGRNEKLPQGCATWPGKNTIWGSGAFTVTSSTSDFRCFLFVLYSQSCQM